MRYLADVCESEDHSALQAVIELCLRTHEWSEIVLLQDETTSLGMFLACYKVETTHESCCGKGTSKTRKLGSCA